MQCPAGFAGRSAINFDVPVNDDRPRVEFFAVVHDDSAGLFHDGKDHHSTQGPSHREGHVGERPEVLREFE